MSEFECKNLKMAFSNAFAPTNLQNFLRSVTPIIPCQNSYQSSFYDINNRWRPTGMPINDCFYLSELWEIFDEWSAYGAGTKIVLNNGEIIDQYYSPYLSAIQIYTNNPSAPLRTPRNEGFGAAEKPWNYNSKDSSPNKSIFGNLYFEYFDSGSPYWRRPLTSRVAEYINNYNGLCKFRNADLSPASWLAVAWYPIYQVPSKIGIKEMEACFLTFHTLSAYYQETFSTVSDDYADTLFPPRWQLGSDYSPTRKVKKVRNYIYLPPFGLATYRLHGDVWINPNSSDATQLHDLHNVAYAWLKQLNVHHHDFSFFSFNSALQSF